MRFGVITLAVVVGVGSGLMQGASAQSTGTPGTATMQTPPPAVSVSTMNITDDYQAAIYPMPLVKPSVVAQAQAAPATAPQGFGAGPAADCGDRAGMGFVDRLTSSYSDHINYDPTAPGTPQRAGYQDPPLSSPPYPSAVWNLGGTVPIGYDAMYKGPLTDSLWCGPYGEWMKNNRLTVYGWVNVGGNLSTSNKKFSQSQGVGGNAPSAYNPWPNTVQLDQAALYFEKTPDTVQTDHFDWGFRLANLYGTDYRYTFSKDVLSNQFLKDRKMLGYDPVMYYGDFYFPGVAEGMNIRVGRYISIPDIEAQLAPNNYTYTHSMLYTYDPYTHHGIVSTIKWNKNWTTQFELSAGNDVWPQNEDAKVTPGVCVSWTSDSGDDNIYPCINGINSGNYGYNNVQHLVATWYHKFDDKWHAATEAWYMYEREVPNVGPNAPANAPAMKPNANGAICTGADPTCNAAAWAVVNYLNYQVGPFDSLTIRNGMLNDEAGQRTGYKTTYSEHVIGWQHWIGDVFTFRPEVRYDRSYHYAAFNRDPSNNTGKRDQIVFAADFIGHF
jgi:hypothetical protein